MTGQHREAERDPWGWAFGLLLFLLAVVLVLGLAHLL